MSAEKENATPTELTPSPASSSTAPAISEHSDTEKVISSESAKTHNGMISNARKEILSLCFNQEHNLFAAAMESGLRIYNVEPLVAKAHLGKLN